MSESINKIKTTKPSDDDNAHADFLAFLRTISKKEVDTKEAEPAVVANTDGQRMKTEFAAAVKEGKRGDYCKSLRRRRYRRLDLLRRRISDQE